ncbi:hypothetical protein JCM5296_002216 [Sporobolomyces johnsonii]
MLPGPLRTLPRRLAAPRQARAFANSTAERRFAVYQSQTTRPVVYASLGLAALFGWTAAVLTVGGPRGKAKKEHGDKASPAPSSPSPSAESTPEPATSDSSQAAAFNPETGEINWDCPCLGGMADGPCGPEFKAAFSCFVYSEAEPKGVDCVEKFRGMQECFRRHPDIYGDDAEDLEADDAEEYDLVSRAEAALQLPDDHFLEKVVDTDERPTQKQAEAAASLE